MKMFQRKHAVSAYFHLVEGYKQAVCRDRKDPVFLLNPF